VRGYPEGKVKRRAKQGDESVLAAGEGEQRDYSQEIAETTVSGGKTARLPDSWEQKK